MDDLHGGASLAKGDERAKDRVFDEPDEEFRGAMAGDHRLNEEAIEASSGTCRPYALDHRRCLGSDPIGMAKIERNTADIALVRDVR